MSAPGSRAALLPLLLLAAAPLSAGTEYKVLADPALASAILTSFGLEGGGEKRDIWFFDTPGLGLFARGLVLRARVPASGKPDSTVKFRPAPDTPPAWVEGLKGFKCEHDANPEGSVYSCSLTAKRGAADINEAVTGGPVAKAFNKEQAKYAGSLDYGSLLPLGPVRSSSWEFKGEGGKIALELWETAGELKLFEISFKTEAEGAAAAEAALKFNAELKARGVAPSPSQGNKTALVLHSLAPKP